jgi:hypothetical protein
MDRNNSEDFKKMLKDGLRPRRERSEDQRNSYNNQKADNAQLIGLVKAMRSDIKSRVDKNPSMQANFDPSILSGDPSTMGPEALQAMLTKLIAADSAVKEAEANSGSMVGDFFDKCKDILFGKKCCPKEAAASVKPIKVVFDAPPPGFVITPNVKKKLQPSVQI